MTVLTPWQRKLFEQWVIETIDETVVPNDEGNPEALIYNLVHLIRGDGQKYDYQDYQDRELESWGIEL
ncbi:MAG TPA: hypothetical protein DDW42_05215 [Desulfobacteraceae bacterium]|nr:hypothetical protein [Desulfobacteraceae bacterium]